jgi:phosphatidylserine decarboxylase
MKHSGKAGKAAWKLILIALVVLLVLPGIGVAIAIASAAVLAFAVPILGALWVLFAIFTLYFFRDPTPDIPPGAKLVVSPAHGKVDVIDTTTETLFMGGECLRISIFLSVIDVHVQNAPVGGTVAFFKYTEGEFMNAMRTECAANNENVLLGFDASDPPGRKIGVRLIAGVIARRIVPFIQAGEAVARGERISLIQFGSRADLYLPMDANIQVKLNDRVVGGETVLAEFA